MAGAIAQSKTRPRPPAEFIRTASDEQALREGAWWDEDAGQLVCDFFEKILSPPKGEHAGSHFRLMEWQEYDLLRPLYSWKRPGNVRRFREGYVQLSKKAGKSTTASGLGLYHLVADGEAGPEVFNAAVDKNQASIIYRAAEAMMATSPSLSRIMEAVPHTKTIVCKQTRGYFRALSSDAPAAEGHDSSFTIIDELHAWKSPDLYRVLKYAGAARRQPLLLVISTAGADRESLCYKQYLYAKKVLSGEVVDTSFFPLIYEAAEDDDFDDPEVWKKANPSLGHTVSLEGFRADWQEAKNKPSEWASFLRYRLGIWIKNEARSFLPRAKWDASAGGPLCSEALDGRACYAGLDLASVSDLAAFVLAFETEDGGLDVVPHFFVPRESAQRRENTDRVPYLAWANSNHITLTDGDVIDYSVIKRTVLEAHERYNIKQLAVDPWNAESLIQELSTEGVPVWPLPQTLARLSGPTKELERLVLAGKLHHHDHPVLNWNLDNAITVQDSSGNIRVSKQKSREKVDGIVALVNAIAARIADAPQEKPPEKITYRRGQMFA